MEAFELNLGALGDFAERVLHDEVLLIDWNNGGEFRGIDAFILYVRRIQMALSDIRVHVDSVRPVRLSHTHTHTHTHLFSFILVLVLPLPPRCPSSYRGITPPPALSPVMYCRTSITATA